MGYFDAAGFPCMYNWILMPTGDKRHGEIVDYFFAPALKFDVPISLRLRDVRGGHARQLERWASVAEMIAYGL